ncbi:hypothetical protein RKE29_03710 [Streptomyces sp. B1866]|uniref:hypothetical protein n=1 Tax=Streptomyces sp. B1866 TaxID=3075431 RepID=UPI00288F1B60|nr:hypothetical protein [Streptomyces sp. B1866]MDT3395762.1 hypothetical protein [Streptomyces sp. B1866]
MTRWTPDTLVRIDAQYDRARASDGHSRFGVYLAQRPALFHEPGEPDTPLANAEEFAAAVWQVACAPVMSPGYVRVRPDLTAVRIEHREDGEGLLAVVDVPLPHTALRAHLPYRWRDWQPARDLDDDADGYAGSWLPGDDRPAVLVTAQVRVPLVGPWPVPAAPRGLGLTVSAMDAVDLLAEQVNQAAGPMVTALIARPGGAGGGAW